MGESAFYANYDHHLDLFKTLKISLSIKIILKDISKLKRIYEEIS